MKNSLMHKYNLKDADELEYDMASAMDRVVSFFCLLPHQLVDNIMDRLEAEKRTIELEHAGVVLSRFKRIFMTSLLIIMKLIFKLEIFVVS